MAIPGHPLPDEAALCLFLTPEGERHLGWLDQPNPHVIDPPAVVDLTRVSEGTATSLAHSLTYRSWHSYYTASPYVPLSDFAALVILAQPAHLDIPRPLWDNFAHWLSLAVPDSFVLPLDAVTLLAPIDAQLGFVPVMRHRQGGLPDGRPAPRE